MPGSGAVSIGRDYMGSFDFSTDYCGVKMIKEIKIILKDILKIFLFTGSLILIVSAFSVIIVGLIVGIQQLSTNVQIPIIILAIIIACSICSVIGYILHFLLENIKKRAKK